MRRLALLVPPAALVVAALLPARGSAGDDHDPARLFTARCAGCHAVPDPGLRGDRAWLDQVHRTA